MKIIGLTGSIGMGKSTVATMFEDCGVPAHNSDDAVHALLQKGAAGYNAVTQYFAGEDILTHDAIDRAKLGQIVFHDAQKRTALEKILHPLVHADQKDFIAHKHREGYDLVVLDIPLLFETGGEARVDVVVVVSAPADTQRKRVLARKGMTEEKFRAILDRQIPDAEKRARADYVIDTGASEAQTRGQVETIIKDIKNNE